MKPKLPWRTIVEVKPKPGFLEPYCRGETEASLGPYCRGETEASLEPYCRGEAEASLGLIVELKPKLPGALL